MQSVAHSLTRRLFKPLAFSLALLSLLFLAQVFPHSHANNHEASACAICQIGHVGVTQAVSSVSASVPFVNFGRVIPAAAIAFFDPVSSDSPSRAPPSSLE